MRLTAARALYLSPSASHPRDYGNRNRVWQTTQFLQQLGFEIHFLLYPMENDWSRSIPRSADEMRKCWTNFAVIPPSKVLHKQAAGQHHEVDEWWDPQIGHHLSWLFARQHYDLFFVNYTFLSKAFEYAPITTKKLLDTHDIFAGRREMLENAGATPEFFYTTIAEEQKAFERADILLGIKDSDADFIREHTKSQVICVPYFPSGSPPASNPVASHGSTQGTTLKVGFIGALNTVNVLNMQRFLAAFRQFERVFVPPIEIKVAGDVCSRLAQSRTTQLLGKVQDIDAYYSGIDVIVAPLMFSTGLKIKVAEALAYGKPVVATENAFDGFQATDEYHTLPNYNAVCRALIRLAYDPDRMAKLTERSAVAARLAQSRRDLGFKHLSDRLRSALLRTLFITDRPLWKQNNLEISRLAHWADFCADILPTVIVYTGTEAVPSSKPENLKALAVVGIPHATTEEIAAFVGRDLRGIEIAEVVLATSDAGVATMMEEMKSAFGNVSLDVWSSPSICRELMRSAGGSEIDILCVEAERGGRPLQGISVIPLRYLPVLLHGVTLVRSDAVIAALCDPTADDLTWLEILRRRLSGRQSVTIIGSHAAECDVNEEDLFGYLREHGKPTVIVAVGSNQRMVRLYQTLARYLGVAFERLSGSDLPRMRTTREGQLVYCETLDDEIRCIAEERLQNWSENRDAADAGWSSYWQLVQARARADRGSTLRSMNAGET
jgi:glycosyltransferase involved in cell wall biosynthesis